MTNNAINNTVPNNDFSVNRSDAGTSCVHSTTHSDNTNTASSAVAKVQCGGTSGGDAFARFSVSGGQDYSIGVDNSASDGALIIKDDANPSSGNTLWEMTTAGERTLPLNSGFTATADLQSNVTGSAGAYNVRFANERFDQNNNFDSIFYFTAPVSGIYVFSWMINMLNAGTADNMQSEALTTGPDQADYFGMGFNTQTFKDSSNNFSVGSLVGVRLDAADTFRVIIAARFGTNVIDVATTSFMSGGLAC